LCWGEIHTHTALSDGNGSPEDNFEIAESHMDFWAMADHAYDREVFDKDYRKLAPGRRILNECWAEIQRMCREREAPGKFIPLLAYEWTNFQYGHHNVYYLDYDEPIRMPATLPRLYESLLGVDALVIPHHGGYPVGICGKNWDFHDDRLSPFVEIYSLHGSDEEPCGIEPLFTSGSWMGPGGSGGSVQEGLARGYKLGIMASSDSHGDHPGAYDNGLIAAYADELTRPALWDAFQQRRIYGVTGDRIGLDFRVNGRPMGSSLECPGPREIAIAVSAWDKVDRVDIIKNNSVLHSFAEPAGTLSRSDGKIRFRFMVEWGWDQSAEREWEGSLETDGGHILQAVPCYRGPVARRVGRGVADLADSECRWTSRTPKLESRKCFRSFADGIAFELECDEQRKLQFRFRCDDMRREWTMSQREIIDGAMVRYMVDVPATNNGAHWHQMESVAKVKVHQGWPSDTLALNLTHEDEPGNTDGNETDFYYTRVIQRNGQRAWSSPIWVGKSRDTYTPAGSLSP